LSIIVPVYNPDPSDLRSMFESVVAQSYRNWELCLADDASPKAYVTDLLHEFAAADSRVKVLRRQSNGGISAASNTAATLAAGAFLIPVDQDDQISRHALAYFAEALERTPDADLLYSDEDKLDPMGNRYDPFFKPDWSPDLLLSENYICHLAAIRKTAFDDAGGYRSVCDGSQDHDLFLRITERTSQVVHVPHVLYHWRASNDSTAVDSSNKTYAAAAARRALEDACSSRGASAVQEGLVPGRWRVRYPLPSDLRVSIIIASGGNTDVLETNLRALAAKTSYRNYEVVVIDNSKHDRVFDRLRSSTVKYIDWRHKPFNYSRINNEAARRCDSPVLLFLNDDTEVIAPDWLESMVELIARPEVGAVGAKLVYPNGCIQHAGVVMGLFDNCGHAFKGLDSAATHYFDFSDVIRNVSAVTGACLMTRAEIFRQVGGFDETAFAVAFNDIDLCLKIGALGYRVLYTPHSLLYHHEAFSKTEDDLEPHPAEVAAMRSKWSCVIHHDPFYSPNLTRDREDYSVRRA
jgi:GT2 family glycosyltransferase